MAGKHVATVHNPDGTPVHRIAHGTDHGPMVFEREEAHRAWLSARNHDFPPGVRILVHYHARPVPGTTLQALPKLVHHRQYDGERWIEVETGEPVP